MLPYNEWLLELGTPPPLNAPRVKEKKNQGGGGFGGEAPRRGIKPEVFVYMCAVQMFYKKQSKYYLQASVVPHGVQTAQLLTVYNTICTTVYIYSTVLAVQLVYYSTNGRMQLNL